MSVIFKTISRAILKGKKARSYPDRVESAGAAQKLQKGIKKVKPPRKGMKKANPLLRPLLRKPTVRDTLDDRKIPFTRMDDSARREFARRNLK